MSLSNLEYCNFPVYNAQNFALNVIDIQWCALYMGTRNHATFSADFTVYSINSDGYFSQSNKIKYGKIQSLDWHCVIVR